MPVLLCVTCLQCIGGYHDLCGGYHERFVGVQCIGGGGGGAHHGCIGGTSSVFWETSLSLRVEHPQCTDNKPPPHKS